MAGGSSNIRNVKEVLSDYFDGRDILHQVEAPEDCVRKGASLLAGSLQGDPDLAKLDL